MMAHKLLPRIRTDLSEADGSVRQTCSYGDPMSKDSAIRSAYCCEWREYRKREYGHVFTEAVSEKLNGKNKENVSKKNPPVCRDPFESYCEAFK